MEPIYSRLLTHLRSKQTGNSLKNLIAPLDDSPNADRYVFRIHKDRVYYVRLSIANLAVSIGTESVFLFLDPVAPASPSLSRLFLRDTNHWKY